MVRDFWFLWKKKVLTSAGVEPESLRLLVCSADHSAIRPKLSRNLIFSSIKCVPVWRAVWAFARYSWCEFAAFEVREVAGCDPPNLRLPLPLVLWSPIWQRSRPLSYGYVFIHLSDIINYSVYQFDVGWINMRLASQMFLMLLLELPNSLSFWFAT